MKVSNLRFGEFDDFGFLLSMLLSMIGNFVIGLFMISFHIYPNFFTWCDGCNANLFIYQILFIFGIGGILTITMFKQPSTDQVK